MHHIGWTVVTKTITKINKLYYNKSVYIYRCCYVSLILVEFDPIVLIINNKIFMFKFFFIVEFFLYYEVANLLIKT